MKKQEILSKIWVGIKVTVVFAALSLALVYVLAFLAGFAVGPFIPTGSFAENILIGVIWILALWMPVAIMCRVKVVREFILKWKEPK